MGLFGFGKQEVNEYPGAQVGGGVIVGVQPPPPKHRCNPPRDYDHATTWLVWQCHCGQRWRLEPTGYNHSGYHWNQWERFSGQVTNADHPQR